jgi:hypothetical protein
MTGNKLILTFTGTSEGMTAAQQFTVGRLLTQLKPRILVLHHGSCVGADEQCHNLCLLNGIPVTRWPSTVMGMVAPCTEALVSVPPQQPLKRNRLMVDASTGVIAAPAQLDEVIRSGTWSTVRYARKAGKPIVLIAPDGEVVT